MYYKNFVAAVRADGQILREKDGKVCLPFGAEYSLLLKNLNSTKASVAVSIDGKDVLSGRHLIILPNTSIDLERYLEDNDQEGHRFKFIQMTDRIRAHRGETEDDGIVRIEYQFEEPAITISSYPGWYVCDTYKGPSDGTSVTWTSGTSTYTCSASAGLGDKAIRCMSMQHQPGPEDNAGITVKGSQSNQHFRVANIGALDSRIYVISFQLVGELNGETVIRPVTKKTKVRCETCGMVNSYWAKFCPECGTALH